MTISNELFLSILAMDAYNRGFDPGILLPGNANSIGTATIGDDATQVSQDGAAQAAGFYALSYSWHGQTVISYRGTDNVGFLGGGDGASDFWRGWINGAGVLLPGGQALLAVQFYNSGTGGDVMAGVSGGLAGLVAANDNDLTGARAA